MRDIAIATFRRMQPRQPLSRRPLPAYVREAMRAFVRRMERSTVCISAVTGGWRAPRRVSVFPIFGRLGNYLAMTKDACGVQRRRKAPTCRLRKGVRESGMFYDPDRLADVVRFNRFLNDEMADFVLELARAVRETCGRTRLVAAFYGYRFECYWQAQGPASCGHFALDKFLRSEDIDLLCGPYSYWLSGRCAGRPICTHTTGESVTAWQDLVNEDASHPHFKQRTSRRMRASRFGRSRGSRDDSTRPPQLSFSLARNYGSWWFDHHSHGMWNDPMLWAERTRFDRIASAVGPGAYRPDVYLTFQERMTDYVTGSYVTQGQREDGVASMRANVALSGCVTGTRLVEDVLSGTGPGDDTIGWRYTERGRFHRSRRRGLARAERVATVGCGLRD